MRGGIGHNRPPAEIDLDIATPEVFEPLLGNHRYKGAFGGRGSGKSHFFAELLVEQAIMRPGLRAVCIREIQKTLADSVYALIVDKIKALGVEPLFDIQRDRINTPGGGVIIFRGMQNSTAEQIKSLEGFHIAYVEEAQTLSTASLRQLRPTIRRDPTPEDPYVSEIWFAWNPRFATDPVDDFLRGPVLPPDAIVVNANFSDNPFFPNSLKLEMEFDQRRDRELYEHVWLGEYEKHSESRVFTNWKVQEFEAPEDTIFYFGADWGFAADPTVLVRIFIVGRTIFIDHEAYAVGCEIDHTPYLFAGLRDADIRKLNGQAYRSLSVDQRKWQGVPKCREFQIRSDSARPETISYMQKHGFPKIVPAIKGAGSVEEGVKFLQGFDIVINPRCVHTIGEFRHYSYKIDPHTEVPTSVLADKKNHVIDSARYALEEVRRKTTVFRSRKLPI